MSSTPNTSRVTIDRLNEVLVADFESGKLFWKPRGVSWWDTRYSGKEAFCIDVHGYFCGSVDRIRLAKHRVLWAMFHNRWPIEVDHKDLDKSNNSISNLREVSRVGNQKNLPKMKSNTSGRTGVHYSKKDKVWVSYIHQKGRQIRLGSFVTFDEALFAREEAERLYGYNENGKR
jgi:hypothetical protein